MNRRMLAAQGRNALGFAGADSALKLKQKKNPLRREIVFLRRHGLWQRAAKRCEATELDGKSALGAPYGQFPASEGFRSRADSFASAGASICTVSLP